jgi:hypothetical protein
MAASTRKAYLGEDIHWVSGPALDGSRGPECRAAKVTMVCDDKFVMLTVFNPTGILFKECAYDVDYSNPDTWHYAH